MLDRVRPGPGGMEELTPWLDEQQVPVRALRPDGALVDRRDFHHRDRVAWPPGVAVEPVAVATAAGAGCGHLPLLRAGTAALRAAGIEVLATEADGDRLAWFLAPGQERLAEQVLHRALIRPAAGEPPKGV
jgi:hypothetical protein